jgi:hypothetical protein
MAAPASFLKEERSKTWAHGCSVTEEATEIERIIMTAMD